MLIVLGEHIWAAARPKRSKVSSVIFSPRHERMNVQEHPPFLFNDFRDQRFYIARNTPAAGQAVRRRRAERVGFAPPARASTRTPAVVHWSVDCRTKDRKPCTRYWRKTPVL